MSKIVKNVSGALYPVSDAGKTLSIGEEFTIPPTAYLKWAASSDVIVGIGAADLIINDGSSDLSISDGADLIKGIFPTSIKTTGSFADDGTIDSFGRLRTSDINNIFESTHVNSKQSEFWDEDLTGGGSTTWHQNHAEVHLDVGTASGDRVIRQTFNYFHYAAGESLITRLTGILGAGKANLDVCLGRYDDKNGTIFRVSDGVFEVGIRTYFTGTAVDTWVSQANFNIDKVDGTGQSGITLDLDKSQIFQVDLQWLGVGRVVFSVHIAGKQIRLHEFLHANIGVGVYMSTPHLPIRYEIINTGVTGSSSQLRQICTQVANEGKHVGADLLVAIDNDTNLKSMVSNSFRPVLSYRHKSGVDILTELNEVSAIVTTADDVLIHIYIDAILTGASWVDDSQFLQKDVSATAISGGRKIASFYINKDGHSGNNVFNSKERLGKYIDGTPQTVTVAAKTLVNNASMVANISIKEFF